jgi:hypothetical protein
MLCSDMNALFTAMYQHTLLQKLFSCIYCIFTHIYTHTHTHVYIYIYIYIYILGARGSIVVKALSYKLEGRGFETL